MKKVFTFYSVINLICALSFIVTTVAVSLIFCWSAFSWNVDIASVARVGFVSAYTAIATTTILLIREMRKDIKEVKED